MRSARLDRDATRVVARFFDACDRGTDPDACWNWSAKVFTGKTPSLSVRSMTVSALRVAWFTVANEWPVGGRMFQRCGNRLCVNPRHLDWEMGRVREVALSVSSEGYCAPVGTRQLRSEHALGRGSVIRRLAL